MAIRHNKGFFFSTDALLALGVFMIAMILIIQLRPTTSPSQDTTIIADDILRGLSSIIVNESKSPTIIAMIASEEINTEQQKISVAELVAEYWSENNTIIASLILEESIESILGGISASFAVSHDNLIEFDNHESLRAISRSTRLVSGIEAGVPSRGYSASLFFTSDGRRSTSEYLYFDGLTGMGNIKRKLYLPNDASVYNITMEINTPSNFSVRINDNDCGYYVPTATSEIRADRFNIIESAECNYSTIFLSGQNMVDIIFDTDNPQQKYISGGFIRIFHNSVEDNDHLIIKHDNLITERIYFNGVDELINIFSGFHFPGDITDMSIHLHMQNDAPENNRFYIRIGDKIVYNTDDTGEITVDITNETISSYMQYSDISGITVPIRMGHLESNMTNETGGSADAMVTIQSSSSMNTCDYPYDSSFSSGCDGTNNYIERLLASRIATEALAIEFLNGTDNRMGVVPYHSTPPPGRVLGLTGDLNTVINHIWGNLGSTNPVCFTCAIVTAGNRLRTESDPTKRRAILLMSDGYTNRCYGSPPACGETNALNEAIASACDMWDQDKITIFTVAYGLGADSDGLRAISEGCTDGMHFDAANLTELIDIYINISKQIESLSYQEQIPIIEGDISSVLMPGSYIEATYHPYYQEQFGLLTIRGQTPSFTSQGTQGLLSINNPDMLRDASVLSYSGDRWTSMVSVNNNVFYNISDYGANYTMIGDPYRIMVPLELLMSGNNDFILSLTNVSYASPDNKITYTAYINNSISAYGQVVARAEGCNWNIMQADGNIFSISIPSSYTGAKECHYHNQSYDTGDAYDISAYSLISQLDINNDGSIDIYLTEQDLIIESNVIENVPSLWGPALFEVRVGR